LERYTGKRLQIPHLESLIAERARFLNPEQQSCREIFRNVWQQY
jgi:hypothetical protein